jgi:hypothetical protein
MISFLVQLQHLPLPSLIVTSSQVRVSTPLPLQSCCISGLGPDGLRHNHTIPVWSPGNLLRGTLASRGNSASKNLQQEAQWPKCCLYETPYIATPVRESGDVIARTPHYAQLPTDAPTRTRFVFGSRVTCFSRDLSHKSKKFLRTFSMRKPRAKAVPSKDYFMHLRTLKNARKGC